MNHFDKDPSTVVAASSLIAEIPHDTRTPSANLDFHVNKDEIISRFSEFCGHGATIKICGACAIGDVMTAGESHQLPLTHNRVTFFERHQEYLQRIPQSRRDSMNLLEHNGKVYHLDAAAFNEADETVTICESCYNSIAHALRTGKPPIGTLAFYDYGIVPATLPELSLAEEIATSLNIIMQTIINLKPLAGVSVTAAKGDAIALPLTGANSLATVVYKFPREDLCDHIRLVVVAKKNLRKPIR